MKFLVIWHIDIALLSRGVMQAVLKMSEYAKPLEEQGKVLFRYHIVGSHGGAWMYNVESNEELDMLLARSPIYNFSHYTVYPLAEMVPPEMRAPDSEK